MACKYKSTLDNEAAKVALEELNEDPKETLGAIQTLWDWVKQQPHLKCPKDEKFLVMFLRFAHFSQLGARERLDKFLTCITKNRDLCGDIDIMEYLPYMRYGAGFPLPGTDFQGRLVTYQRESLIDDTKIDVNLIARAGICAIFSYMIDERNQVYGITSIMDGTNFKPKFGKSILPGWETRKRVAPLLSGNFPARLKSMHFYNLGELMNSLVALIFKFFPEKMKQRMKFHDSLETVYEIVDKKFLPSDLLPDDYTGPVAGTCDQLRERFANLMDNEELRARILELTSDRYGVDESKRVLDSTPQASFKKLNVD